MFTKYVLPSKPEERGFDLLSSGIMHPTFQRERASPDSVVSGVLILSRSYPFQSEWIPEDCCWHGR